MTQARKGKQPQDHKKPAAQLEAEAAETVTVSWRDHEFTVAADADDWDAETTLAFEEGKVMTGVRGILGAEQWAELMKDRPKNRDMGELFNEIAKGIGLESAGN